MLADSIRPESLFMNCLPNMLLRRLLVNVPLKRQLSSQSTKLPVLTMYTKDPCPLCDQAMGELERYKHRYHFEKVDITMPENKEWYKKYRFDIPVFHLNGAFLMKHRVNHTKIRRKLKQLEQPKASPPPDSSQ